MIIATSVEDFHLHGDILPSIYRLRHQGFKQRQDYDVPDYNGMEYDAYDTPATTYLAWKDNNGVVRGCTRLFPTTRPYMIEDLWPETVTSIKLPKSNTIWEASRFCIDKTLPSETRRQIHGELLCAFQEFGIQQRIDWMIGVMTPPIWRTVFTNAGWPIEYLGAPLELAPREKILSGKMQISPKILKSIKNKFFIKNKVLKSFNNQKKRA